MKQESDGRKFAGRRAWWWYLVVIIVTGSTLFVVYAAIVAPGAASIMSAIAMSMVFILALAIQFRNDLTVEDDGFIVRFGFVTKRILYKDIRSIQYDRNLMSTKETPAHRLGVELVDGGFVIVSARDMEGFEHELRARRRKAMRGS